MSSYIVARPLKFDTSDSFACMTLHWEAKNLLFLTMSYNINLVKPFGNYTLEALLKSEKCQNSVNFVILVRKIEIKCLFPLVEIQNITENLISFRNMVFTGRGHLD